MVLSLNFCQRLFTIFSSVRGHVFQHLHCIIRCRGTHLCLTPLRIAISSVAVSSTRTIVVCLQYRLLIMRASFSSGPSWFKTSQPIMSHRVKSLFDETGKHIHVHVPTFLDQYLHEKQCLPDSEVSPELVPDVLFPLVIYTVMQS